MKYFALSLLATLAAGSPIAAPAPTADASSLAADFSALESLDSKPPPRVGIEIRNDLENGTSSTCPQGSILVFARGTNEIGNVGDDVGVPLVNSLAAKYGNGSMWVQGVGGPYKAEIPNNFLPQGASQTDISEAVRLLNEANTKCPNTTLIAGGYSQGSALMAAAVSQVATPVKNQLKGVVLFGYTKNKQNDDQIPTYPVDQTKIFCNPGDLVCNGTLIILKPHLEYAPVAMTQGAQFVESIVNGAI